MATISEALTAYRIYAKAEGKSPKTILWIMSSVTYFSDFLGDRQHINEITGDDLRRFIINLQDSPRFREHPYIKPQNGRLSPHSIETYARGIRAFFGNLYREGLIEYNPMAKVRMPRVPKKVVPTLSEREVHRLLAQPNRQTNRGFRDYALLLVLIDTGARLSEVTGLRDEDVNLEEGYLRVMGKGGRERYIPFGVKVAKVLLKYRMKHRPRQVATDAFWLTVGGYVLKPDRVEKIISNYGRQAGIQRCYPHKLRHTASVMYLRNGGDPFSLQKKLGHSSLQMTRHYSNLADSDVKAQHMKFGVVDRLRL